MAMYYALKTFNTHGVNVVLFGKMEIVTNFADYGNRYPCHWWPQGIKFQ